MNISRTDFKQILTEEPLDELLSKYLLESIPSIFNSNIESFIEWKVRLSSKINVDPKCILIMGGANIGFSLNPNKNFNKFTVSSDIDVALVSSFYFDVAWKYLQQLGTEWFDWNINAKNSLKDHRKRLIYWGTIATDKIIECLPFGKEWVLSLEEMKKVYPTKNREINIRIYRDFESLRVYQKQGLEKLRDKIMEANLK